jgi:hypothetical protein
MLICMDAQITREMIDAARNELPGAYNRDYVRRALRAALALVPDPTTTPAAPTPPPETPETPELGTIPDIARRLGAPRSTVHGWAKNRSTNHMPEPVNGTHAYDLAAIDTWHAQRKGHA